MVPSAPARNLLPDPLPATPKHPASRQRGRMGGMTSPSEHRRKRAHSVHPESVSSLGTAAAWSPSRPVLLALAGCLAAATVLSACAGGSPAGPSTSTGEASATSPAGSPAPSTQAPPAAAAPSSVPAAGDAPATAALKQTLADALNRLAAGTPKPATAQVTDALTGAGIPGPALEVSESRTPTGLEADAIEAAVLQGTDCVVGQIRDGSVTISVLPVLASGKCFVGTPA
jgi:hypothetical protein